MSVILDASVVAAWVLPDEENSEADAMLYRVAAQGAVVPSLIWHELRNILLMANRRKRLPQEEILPCLLRLRRLPIETANASMSGDAELITLATTYGLTAYDAAYLALAAERDLPLATHDKKLRQACNKHGLILA